MIALALVASCSIPLLKGPFLHLRMQIEYFNEIDMHLESERILGKIKEMLVENKITWKDLCDAQKGKKQILTYEFINDSIGTKFTVKCFMKSSEFKKINDDSTWMKARFEISFYKVKNKKCKTFWHTICVVQQKATAVVQP